MAIPLKFGWNERAEFEQYLRRRLAGHAAERIGEEGMILHGKVIEIASGSEYSDHHERVTFRLSECPDSNVGILVLANIEGWKLDDSVEVSISMPMVEEVAPLAFAASKGKTN